MTYRVDLTGGQMGDLINRPSRDANGRERPVLFNTESLEFANTFGLNLAPRRQLTQQQKAAMQLARSTKISNNLSRQDDSFDAAAAALMEQVRQAAKRIQDLTGFPFSINTADRKFYFSVDGRNVSNYSRLKNSARGRVEYFDPAWQVMINYNKLANAGARRIKASDKGWTAQDLMNRAAKSQWRNLLKKARSGWDPVQASARMISAVERRNGATAAAVTNLRRVLGGRADIGGTAPTRQMNEEVEDLLNVPDNLGGGGGGGTGGGAAWARQAFMRGGN